MLRVTLLGNLGADPEARYTAKGTQIVSLRVAVNQIRIGPDGERQENTEWFRVSIGGRQMEFAQRLSKGSRVLVVGRLTIGHYQSREGEMRTSFDVWADDLQAVSSGRAFGMDADGAPEADGEAREPALAGVSSLASGAPATRAPSANGKRVGQRGESAAAAEAASDELEDLPF